MYRRHFIGTDAQIWNITLRIVWPNSLSTAEYHVDGHGVQPEGEYRVIHTTHQSATIFVTAIGNQKISAEMPGRGATPPELAQRHARRCNRRRAAPPVPTGFGASGAPARNADRKSRLTSDMHHASSVEAGTPVRRRAASSHPAAELP